MIYPAVRYGWRVGPSLAATNIRNMVIVLGLFLSTYIVFQWEFSLLSMRAPLLSWQLEPALYKHCGLINADEPSQMYKIRAQSHRFTGRLMEWSGRAPALAPASEAGMRCPNADRKLPKVISPVDPCSAWTHVLSASDRHKIGGSPSHENLWRGPVSDSFPSNPGCGRLSAIAA